MASWSLYLASCLTAKIWTNILIVIKKVKLGQFHLLGELHIVHRNIQRWYQRSCSKVKDQARVREFQANERVTIYHHEIHRKMIKKSCILKLETPQGLIEGHEKCSKFLEDDVKNLLLSDAGLLPSAQTELLEEVTLLNRKTQHFSPLLLCKKLGKP